MKNRLASNGLGVWGPRFVMALSMVVAVSCAGVIEDPKPCTCDCLCNTGRTYCKSDSIQAGTVECSNTCVAIGTGQTKCKDKTRTDIELPPFDPPDPVECTVNTPHLFQPFVFCEICSDFPASETDHIISACTEEEAQSQAELIAEADGGESQDCSIADGYCSNQ